MIVYYIYLYIRGGKGLVKIKVWLVTTDMTLAIRLAHQKVSVKPRVKHSNTTIKFILPQIFTLLSFIEYKARRQKK